MNTPLTIALPTGRLGEQAIERLQMIGLAKNVSTKTRKLTFTDDANIKYIMVKPIDVITYVEKKVADVGIIGSDVILEQQSHVYEIADLGFGQCKFSLAGLNQDILKQNDAVLTVATKYPMVTKAYFKKRGLKLEIIKINGSVELAPLLGLSDVIVDIVETGKTLKANGLIIIEDILDVSAKAIVNRVSYRFKYDVITDITKRLENSMVVKSND